MAGGGVEAVTDDPAAEVTARLLSFEKALKDFEHTLASYRELEHLARQVASLSNHLDGAQYNRRAYMALYDVRASLRRLGFQVSDNAPAGKP